MDEITCPEPFYLPKTDSDVFHCGREVALTNYLDWCFRLLREDIVYSVFEEVSLIIHSDPKLAKQKARLQSRTIVVDKFSNISFNQNSSISLRLVFQHPQSLQKALSNAKNDDAKCKLVEDFYQYRSKIMKKDSLLAFMENNSLLGLGIVSNRNVENLKSHHPSVDALILEESFFKKSLLSLGQPLHGVSIVQLSAPFFAFAPILERLKELSTIALEPEILHGFKKQVEPAYWNKKLEAIVQGIETGNDLSNILWSHNSTMALDDSQKLAITKSLRSRVGLIQGPPGTGKSYCGALLAKIIHDFTDETILCVCYTNHALDQFLEDLMIFGIPKESLVRIGGTSKVSDKIKPLVLQNLLTSTENAKSSRVMQTLRYRLGEISRTIKQLSEEVITIGNSTNFSHFAPIFTNDVLVEFEVPQSKTNQPLAHDYLWLRWINNDDRGVLQSKNGSNYGLWAMSEPSRKDLLHSWRKTLLEPLMKDLEHEISYYNSMVQEYKDVKELDEIDLLKSKRVIGCTTTGAAKYSTKLDGVDAGVLIIEEAAEILEPHVITSRHTLNFQTYIKEN